jgi:hypothetical protein
MFIFEEVQPRFTANAGKYFQAVAALTAANKISKGDERVMERIKKLKEKVEGVDVRNDLKDVLQNAVKSLETVQNGI